MADATTLIRRALDSGIELQFVDGVLRVTGRRSAVMTWAPKIKKHKTALIERLQESSKLADQVLHAAMRACDAHGDNEAARQQMRLDIEATPQDQLRDLLQHFRTAYPRGGPRS